MMTGTAEEIVDALKKKLFCILAVFAVGVVVGFPMMGGVLQHTIEYMKPDGASIVYLTPLEVIMLKLKMAIICGALLALPVTVYFAYRAVVRRTGITIHRSSLVVTGIFAAILFISGVLYAYFLLPLFLNYLFMSASTCTPSRSISLRRGPSLKAQTMMSQPLSERCFTHTLRASCDPLRDQPHCCEIYRWGYWIEDREPGDRGSMTGFADFI